MRLSKRCEHGLKAAVQLALHDEKGFLQAREIAQTESLPGKFIESILSSLRAAALLESKVGARGGYKLARPASEIFVAELIRALEGDETSEFGAGDRTPGVSALETLNHRIDHALEDAVGSLTLADLMSEPSTIRRVRLGGDESAPRPRSAGELRPAASDGPARPSMDGALTGRP